MNMKRTKHALLAGLGAALLLSGCGTQGTASGPAQAAQTEPVQAVQNTPAASVGQGSGQADDTASASTAPSAAAQPSQPQAVRQPETSGGAVDSDTAFAIALGNAGVPEEDVQNRKVERDEDNSIPIYDIEFETAYGDYDFEVAIEGGAIVGADYEVDEEWLATLGGSAVSLDEAKEIVQGKVPGAPLEDIQIWEESEDGQSRYEGELFYGGLKYEFELDPNTGRIFDWNADLRL